MSPTKQRERLTLRDTTDLLIGFSQWVEDHIDELELNGGALTDEMALFLDEITGARTERAEAIVRKLDEFMGYATSAKATKDRAARRQKVWDNTIAALKAYALREVERAGGDPIKAATATLRIQRNGTSSTECTFDNEQLLAFYDARKIEARDDGMFVTEHPLAKYITVTRVAKLDVRAVGAAYEARREELEAEAALLGAADLPPSIIEQLDDDPTPDEIDDAVVQIRAAHTTRSLYAEFPGVTVTRGHHLRID